MCGWGWDRRPRERERLGADGERLDADVAAVRHSVSGSSHVKQIFLTSLLEGKENGPENDSISPKSQLNILKDRPSVLDAKSMTFLWTMSVPEDRT